MGKFSKKAATKGEAYPAVIKAAKPLKRATEDDLVSKVNLKKQKVEVTESMEAMADRLQRIEEKVDLLMTKADLFISAKGKKVAAKKPATSKNVGYPTAAPKNCSVKNKAESSSSEDESSSSDDEESSSSDSDEEGDEDEKPAQVKAKSYTKESSSDDSGDESDEDESNGRFGFTGVPFVGGRLSGGRCGGRGFCGYC